MSDQMHRRLRAVLGLLLLTAALSGCGSKEPIVQQKPAPGPLQPQANQGNAPVTAIHAE